MNSMSGTNATGGFGRGKATGDVVPKGYKTAQLQQFTPEQMRLFQQLFSNVGPESDLSRLAGGDQSYYNEIEAPALQQFNAYQGNLASRFSGMGAGQGPGQSLSSRRSSGFQNTATQAGADFAQQLASQRQALQRQAIMDLHGLSSSLLGQRPYERSLVEKPQQQSTWDKILGGAGTIAGGFASGFGGGFGQSVGKGLFQE